MQLQPPAGPLRPRLFTHAVHTCELQTLPRARVVLGHALHEKGLHNKWRQSTCQQLGMNNDRRPVDKAVMNHTSTAHQPLVNRSSCLFPKNQNNVQDICSHGFEPDINRTSNACQPLVVFFPNLVYMKLSSSIVHAAEMTFRMFVFDALGVEIEGHPPRHTAPRCLRAASALLPSHPARPCRPAIPRCGEPRP